MTDLVEKVAGAMRSRPLDMEEEILDAAKATIAVVLKHTKLECVKQSHGPCVCGFVNKIARENGVNLDE